MASLGETRIGVLGSGLTALDTLIALRQRGHRGEILCLSRRGLRPQAQRSGVAPGWQALETLLPVLGRGAQGRLRALREGLEMAAEGGLDWRDALASLRVHTASIWQAWPLCERRRFLRHLQAYWEVHRHRCAPSTAALLAEMERGDGCVSGPADCCGWRHAGGAWSLPGGRAVSARRERTKWPG